MEGAVLGLTCLLGGLTLVSLVLAIAALGRSGEASRLKKRLDALDAEVARLRVQLTNLAGSARATPATNEPAAPISAPAASAEPPPAAVPPVAATPAAQTPRVAAWARRDPRTPEARAGGAGAGGAPPEPPRPPRAATPPRPPATPVNWEKLLGVGAAAVFGGIVLSLAAFFLVRISIERGWISPALRVAIVLTTGAAAIGSSEALRRRKQSYVPTANALAGAGIVILYAGFWAARAMYFLVDVGPAFGAMAMVTVTAALLALRYDSLVVALLGLVGGFLTPLLINSGRDNPIGLFEYILLLDVALLAVAHHKRWASLQVLSMAGTVLIEGLWIFAKMGPGTFGIGLAAAALFAAVFAVSGAFAPAEERRAFLFGQGAGVLLPFLFAIYFAANTHLTDDPIPVVVLLALLTAMATFLGLKADLDYLGLGASAAGAGVMLVLFLVRDWDLATTWQLAGMTVLLAAIPHVGAERRREISPPRGSGPAAMVGAIGLFLVLILASVKDGAERVRPWLAGELALTLLLLRQSAFSGRAWLQLAPALLLPVGLTLYHDVHLYGRFPDSRVFLAILGITAVIFQANALLRREAKVRLAGEHGAALAALLLLAGLAASRLYLEEAPALPALGVIAALGFFAALSATRAKAPIWYLAASVCTAAAHVLWASADTGTVAGPAAYLPLGILFGSAVLFTAWPFLTGETFLESRMAWRGAALAAPLWFFGLKKLWVAGFGDAAIALLPIGLAALALLAAARARVLWPDDSPIRKSALAWFAAIALAFVSITFPLQLDRQWITIGWALEGVAVIALWTQLDHRGLKYFGLFLLAAVTVRLVFNPAVLEYHPRGGMRIVNWLLYTYSIPAIALLVAARILGDNEVARQRTWESILYAGKVAVWSMVCSLAAIAVVFVLINLEVVDWFATSDRLTLHFERMQSRDLAFSISWLVYAVVLLGIGIWRESKGPRWISLGLLLVSIFKVALYDMGALHDFKLVLSLAGLGATLIVVSLVYQRFLFRSPADPPTPTPEAT